MTQGTLQKLQPDIQKMVHELLENFNHFKKSKQFNQYKDDDPKSCIEAILFVLASFSLAEITGLARRTKIVVSDNGESMPYLGKLSTILNRFGEIQEKVLDSMVKDEEP